MTVALVSSLVILTSRVELLPTAPAGLTREIPEGAFGALLLYS